MFKVRPVNAYSRETELDFPKSYAEARERYLAWANRKGRRSSACKLDGNTTLEDVFLPGQHLGQDRAFAVRLHNTRVVTFYPDGRIMLDSGGWQTPTTRDRMNRCGVRVSMAGGVASVRHGERDACFRDEMTLHPDGGATFGDGKRAPDAEPVRAERRRKLARAQRQFKRGGLVTVHPLPFYWPNRSGGRASWGNAPEAFEVK